LQEKLKRIENGLREAMDEDEFSEKFEEYIMNRIKGKPDYIDDDAI